MTYTMENISKLLPGVTPTGIRAAIQADGLPARKIGKQWYFDGRAVRGWLRHQTAKRIMRKRRQGLKAQQQLLPQIDHFGEEPEGSGS